MAKRKNNQVEPELEKVEESKVEAVEAVEAKPEPQFNNVGDGMKIKLVDGKNFSWITVRKGEIVTIPRKIALANGLVEVE